MIIAVPISGGFMLTSIRMLACCSALVAALPAQATIDISMSPVTVSDLGGGIYGFTQGGWTQGGMVTGTFTAFDLNSDGQINFLLNEVASFSFVFAGSSSVPGFSLGHEDLFGLVYTLGDGLLGDSAVELPDHAAEGIWAFGSAGVYIMGPAVLEVCHGTINCAMVGANDAPQQLVTTASAPEPASWAMLIAGFGLTGAAMRRRHRYRAA